MSEHRESNWWGWSFVFGIAIWFWIGWAVQHWLGWRVLLLGVVGIVLAVLASAVVWIAHEEGWLKK